MHEHEHHEHHHGMEQHITPKKLLESMYTHNRGHLNELIAVAGQLNEDARQKVLQAAELLKQSNEMLGEALDSVED